MVSENGVQDPEISLVRLILSCMVAGGVQYGWALQLSLLTPYVQTLGLPHSLASIMWLCGPIAGFVVGPTIGMWSDRCGSRFGRRKPFILAGCFIICCAVMVIGFSSDIGSALGDTMENCSTYVGPRWKAALIYVVGFWVLDFSNNAVQGPARAMMADLSGSHGCSTGNIIYAFWMAFGNILGYASGASGSWHKWFPFLMTNSCCEACANLKGAFLIAVIFLGICLAITLISAKEVPLSELDAEASKENSGFFFVFKAFKNLPSGMLSVLLMTSLTWMAWFPFILYDTDWMGREIYHGDPNGTKEEIEAFNKGVQQGAFGLLLNSIVLGITATLLEPMCRKFSSRVVWVIGNFTLFLAMVAITVLSAISNKSFTGSISTAVRGPDGIKIGALAIFTALGFPLAILYSIPFATAAQLVANEGSTQQGLCTGVLNVSIVVPQVIIALSAGPWDSLFGKGNVPAFGLAAALAFVGGFVGLALLPKLSRNTLMSSSFGSMH
ncbi:sucrose transport protein SUT1-like [Dendrobium catenatum]|uniref:Sucrose transport protein SUT1 n=1 Tax=Dendrobium catenatum TaxID=906689 RepID=A0A2I0W9S2_9ASPA|nr:sucrose transport protein SUT1-like [Dendrobium catenatum]PKU72403.1 Sucrose transport protein SUT1 [Dendrobium catenatum]